MDENRKISYSQIENYNTRLLFERLDELIAILSGQNTVFDEQLKGLVAGCVPMAPNASITIQVGTTATFLIENTVLSLMRIEITNDDFAQGLYIGNRDLVMPGGRLVQPQETVVYELRKGQKLYGIVAVANINVIISYDESSYGAVTADGPLVM